MLVIRDDLEKFGRLRSSLSKVTELFFASFGNYSNCTYFIDVLEPSITSQHISSAHEKKRSPSHPSIKL